jgi:hypothetical protein
MILLTSQRQTRFILANSHGILKYRGNDRHLPSLRSI